MTQSSTLTTAQLPSFSPSRSLFHDFRTALTCGFTAAVLLAWAAGARAQDAAAQQTDATPAAATAPADTQPKPDISVTNQPTEKKQKTRKEDRVVQSKATKKEVKKTEKDNQLEGIDAKLPDKALYDKAEDDVKRGRYDVARIELQTLLNTYPDTQFMMRAKLAIADSWYKEGGTAALTQAEQEYKDFITFFPNAPEAAEAQMRVGDIYFRQMDKPDRDYSKTVQAEQEYRLMLQQFPDSPLVPQARQRLREVQETLASREADIASFYSGRGNMMASIARYQTVVDSYPLYSHTDEVLIALGDAFEAQAKYVRTLNLPEAGKARLEKIYDDQAADAYRKVVLEHSAAPHVEDAKDRLVGMNLPIPTPTAEQVAASENLENSRGQYTLSKRATVLFLHQADTVPAATIGAPPLEDAKPTLAPDVYKATVANFNNAMNPANAPRTNGQPISATTPAAGDPGAPATAAAPLALQDVPTATASQGTGASSSVTSVQQAAPASSSSGSSMGIEIVQPSAGSSTAPGTAPATPPAFPGTTPAANASPSSTTPQTPAADANGGITAVGPPNSTPLAPIEKPAVAPTPVNEVTPGSQPAAQTASVDGKKPKADYDKSDESSSKHKPKKGLKKLNPF
jgi:outer membrane protein assembly factor BamD